LNNVRDLSLHILDLIENSIRAKARTVVVRIVIDRPADMLKLAIEDDGKGLGDISPQAAANPFYTTKSGKKTGLGLSLLKAAAQRAGGDMTIGRSSLGGVAVEATMQFSHIDRTPIGDLADTFAAVACTNQQLDLRLELRCGANEFSMSSAQVVSKCPDTLAVANEVCERIKAGLSSREFCLA
jgi:signal transduction histidine kinase